MNEDYQEIRISRKEIKQRARRTVKTHYFLLCILCLFLSFLAIERGDIINDLRSGYRTMTGQVEEDAVSHSLIGSTAISAENVYKAIVRKGIKEGQKEAEEQMEVYEEEPADSGVFSRSNGILAAVVNNVTSGNFLVVIATGIITITRSESIGTAVFVVLTLILWAWGQIFLLSCLTSFVRRIFLEARTYSHVPIRHMLYARFVKGWTNTALTLLLRSVLLFLCSLTVIGGLIMHYAWILVPYILAENPHIKPADALRLSRNMMKGHKWECCRLELSFAGWILLGTVTFGFSELLWSHPYYVGTMTEYYASLRREAQRCGIPNAEKLDDIWLYEHAPEDRLKEAYSDIVEGQEYIDAHRIKLPPRQRFLARTFSIWTGSSEEKKAYEDLGIRSFAIDEGKRILAGESYPQRLNPRWTHDNTIQESRINFLKNYTPQTLVLVFFLFSFIGWLWEVSLFLVTDGIFVNRGVLHGPWLPIYGTGGLIVLILLRKFREHPRLEFFLIMLLCGVVEYSTAWYLESALGMKWWDYTGYFLNLDSRICAEGLFVFGLGGMAAVYLIVPVLDSMLDHIDPKIVTAAAVLLLACFIPDVIYSRSHPNAGEGITDAVSAVVEPSDPLPDLLTL